MKKSGFAAAGFVTAWLFSMLFGGIIQGSNGAQVSGGACTHKSAAPLADSDNDGIVDELDNCPGDYNPSQSDEDGNGVGEVCEPFKPFDGVIECELPACNSDDECRQSLQDLCPDQVQEVNFLGLVQICCDRACEVKSAEDTGLCPAGTCPPPFFQCSSDQECIDNGFTGCLEGCCIEVVAVPPGDCTCICPPEDPECTCPSCPPEPSSPPEPPPPPP